MKTSLQNLLLTVFSVATFICLFSTADVYAQFPSTGGTYTIDTTLGYTFAGGGSGNFKSFKSAIKALNATTANTIAGNVTFNVAAGETFGETEVSASATYVANITYTNATGANITFKNSGTPGVNNPVLMGTSGNGSSDIIIEVTGGSNYTFNGINFFDNPTNSSTTTEFEIGIKFITSATTGNSNNTIQNSTVSMNLTNTNSTYGIWINSGSSTITNNYNHFYNNTIQNIFYGYYFENTSNGAYDIGDEVGTSTIQSFKNYAIYCNTQNNFKAFNNIITNSTYVGSQTGSENGIYFSAGFYSCTGEFYGNNINSFNTSSNAYGIQIANSNIITSDIYSNSITNITSTGGEEKLIRVLGGNCNIYNNYINNANHGTTGSNYGGICIEPANSSTINIIGNTVSNLAGTGSTTGGILIQAWISAAPSYNISYNNISFINPASGNVAGIYTLSSSYTTGEQGTFLNNIIHDISNANGSAVYGIYAANMNAPAGPTIGNNLVYSIKNLSKTGGGNVAGIWNQDNAGIIYNNVVYGIRADSTSGNSPIYGIWISENNNATGVNEVYYNTVYLNGVSYATSVNTRSYALYSNQELGAGDLDVRNNIFINATDLTLSTSGSAAYGFNYATGSHDYSGFSLNSNNNIIYSGRQKAGAGTITTSGTAVTGVGTTFTTQLFVGAMLYLGSANGQVIGTVKSITDDTHATLVASASNAATGNTYDIMGIANLSPAGTISVSGTAVTGTGTSFLTDLVANMVITDNLGNYLGTINTVPTSTSATLTVSGTSYSGTYQANGNRDLLGSKHYTFYDNSTTWAGISGYRAQMLTMPTNTSRETNTKTLINNTPATLFTQISAVPFDLHLPAGAVDAANQGTLNLGSPFLGDYDGNVRPTGATQTSIGAFEGTSCPANMPVAAGTVAGTTLVCPGTNGVAYSVGAIGNTTNYMWTVPAGAVVASGQGTNSITVNYSYWAVNGNVTVTGVNTCGSGTSASLGVTINSVPGTPGTITGTTPVCQGQSGFAYSVPALANTTGYTWALPAGGAIGSGNNTNSITANYSSVAATGGITVAGTNACGTGIASAPFGVTVNPLPGTPVISGSNSLCQGQFGVSYSASSTSATGYNWTVPNGVTIASGIGTSNITVNVSYSAISGSITATATNTCGSSPSGSLNVVIGSSGPSAAGTISGPTTVCQGSSQTYSVSATGATAFNWTLPSGYSIVGVTNGSSIVVNFTTSAASGNITVAGANACGTGASSSLAVAVSVLPDPAPAISGSLEICAGQSGSYSIPTLNNATGYTWTVPGNASINSGQGTNGINVTFNGGGSVLKTGTGTISCSTSNYIVTGTGTQFLTEEYIGAALFDPATGDAIGWIAAIASNTQLYLNGANNPALTLTNSAFEYGGTLSPITGTGYQSSCGGTGFTGVGTSFTSQLNVNDVIFYAQNSVSCCAGFYNAVNLVSSINSNTSVTLAGSAYGTCTTGSPGEPMNHGGTSPITGSITISGTTLTGVGTKFTTELFPGALIVSGTINYVNFGMVSYVTDDTHATLCPGTSSLTNASGFRHTGGFPLPFTGNITITPTGACGASASSSISVTTNAVPQVSASSPNPLLSCGGTPVTLNASSSVAGTTFTWSPATGLSATTGATVLASPAANTTYTVTGTISSGCGGTGTIAVAVSGNLSGLYTVDNTVSGSANLFPNTNVFNNFSSIAAVMGCIVGPTTFVVTDGETFTLSGPISFTFTNPNDYPITFVRSNAGTQPIIQAYTGTGTSDYMFQLNGSSYFTFNGLNFKENPANTTATTEMEAAIYMTPAFSFGCTYNTVENCTISLNIFNTNSSYGILTNVPSGTTTPNSYNTYYNNAISNVGYGIYLVNGVATGGNVDYGNVINANTITNIKLGGVYVSTQDGFQAFNNTINGNAILTATGTITATTSSTSLTGSGTAFTTQLFVGAAIVNTAGTYIGTVASIASDISATLTGNASSAISAGTFAVYSSTSGLNGIYATYGFTAPNTQVMKFYSNNIINLGSTSSVHGYYQGSNVYQANIYSNTVNNLFVTSSELIGINIGGGNFNLNNNYVNNVTHVVLGTSGADVAGIELGGSDGGSGNCTTANIIGNTVSNIMTNTQQYSSSSFYNESGGILIGPSGTSTPSALNVSYNNVSFVVNSPNVNGDYHCGIGIKSGSGSAYSIPNAIFSNNIIHDISSTSTGNREMSGLRILGCVNASIFNNLVYNITCNSAGSQTSGLLLDDGSGNTSTLIYNNIVYDVYANNSGSLVAGLALHQPGYTYTGTSINGIHQVYYNTVYMGGTATSSGISAAFYSDNSTTTNGLDYRNNIFINNVTESSSGKAVAFYYGSTSYTGILAGASAATSPNNNLLYAGTAGTQHLIFYNGSSSYQTLATYQATIQSSGANRETQAVTLSANTPATLFNNIATVPYDLHLQSGATDAIQKGTLPLSSPYLTDFDGNVRPTPGNTNTTVGVYEPPSCPANAAGAAGSISGPATVCSGQTGVIYSVAAITNVISGFYTWTVPTGATITAGAGTNSITVDFTSPAASGNVTVNGYNGCGNGTSATQAVTVNAPAATPGAVTGASPVCQGQNGVAYSVVTVPGVSTYNWTIPTGSTIASGSNTNSIVVNFSSSAATGIVTVSGTGSCGTGNNSPALAVTVNPLPSTGTISGNNLVCQGTSGVAYSVVMSNANSYTWTVPSGASVASGAGTNSITVNYSGSASSGNVTVYGTNTCGNGPVASYAVSVNGGAPSAAGSISGASPICQNQSGVVYSVAAIANASSYNWTVPTGATIASGGTTNTITVNYSASAVSGNVTVNGVNGCGNGTSSSLPVTVNNAPATPAAIFGSTSVCLGSNATYSVAPVANATGYTWTVPGGATIVAGATTNYITVNYSLTAANGLITAAGTNACGTGPSASLSVILQALPTITATYTNNGLACAGGSVTLTASGASTYSWSPASTLSSAVGTTVTSSPLVTTNYIITGIASTGCSNTGNITVTAYPTVGGNYTIDNTVSGAANLFPNTNVFNSFTSAVGALTCLGGPVTFSVIDNEVFSESPITIATINTVTSYPVIFRRSGTGTSRPILYGTNGTINNSGNGDAIITLKNSSYITFDGIDFRDNPANAGPTLKMEVGILMTSQSSGVPGCRNNTIVNCNIQLDSTEIESTIGPIGVHIINTINTTGNNNNSFYNNTISRVLYGYFFDNQNTSGGSAAMDNNNVIGTINGGISTISSVFSNGQYVVGVYLKNQDNISVFNTTIKNVTSLNGVAAGIDYRGSAIGLGTGYFYNNIITNINSPQNAAYGWWANNGTIVQSNIYGNTISYINANGSQPLGIFLNNGNANIYNNNVSYILHPVPNPSNGGFDAAGIYVGGAGSGTTGNASVVTVNITGNTISNVLANDLGTNGSSPQNVQAGIVVCPSTSASGIIENVSYNNISNIISPGSVNIYGIVSKSVSGTTPSTRSVFANNVIYNVSSYGQTGGIFLNPPIYDPKVYNNNISHIYQAGANGSSVNGILVGAVAKGNYFNNMIYDLSGNLSTSVQVYGISLSNAPTADTLAYNTIYLNPSFYSSQSASTAVFACLYCNSTTGTNGLLYRNNIFINDATNPTGVNGQARACIIQYNNTTYTGIDPATNNNLLWLPGTTPSPPYCYFSAGAGANSPLTATTLANYKTLLSPRDNASQTLTATLANFFVSPVSPYNVHLNTAGVITDAQGEGSTSMGAPFLTDIDGDLRAISGNTTIGADEISNCPANAPGAAATIVSSAGASPASLCQGTTGITFSIPAITNVSPGFYTWTVPAGAAITSGIGTNSITVSFGSTAGNVTVSGMNGCGTGTSSSFTINLNSLPSTPGTIAGTSSVCQGASGIAFSVPAVSGATTYNWTLPSGASITTGSNTNSIAVNFTPTAVAGGLVVSASNGCGTSLTSQAFNVTVNPLPGTPGNVTGTSVLCQGTGGVLYSVPPIANATGYNWVLPTGATILAGANSNLINVNYSITALSGNVTVNGTNACGSGTSSSFAVTVNPLPVITVTPASAVCTGSVQQPLTAAGNSTGYVWAPSANITATTGANVTVQISQLTFYTVTGTASGGCTANVVVPVATVATGGSVSPIYSIICSGGTQVLTSSGAAGHDYQWQISTDNVNWSDISGATNTIYTTNTSDGNTNKYYRMIANSNACWNVASTTGEVDVSNPTITVSTTNITDQTITLNWVPIGSGNYAISYSGTSSGTLTSVTPPKTLTGLVSDGTYSITVTQTGAGLAACPASGTVTGVTTLCAMPTGVTLSSPAPAQIQVSWTGTPGADYRVYYRPLFSYTTYFTKDVSNASSVLLTKQGANNIYASTTYEVYVSRLDCPTTGVVGQGTNPTNVTTLPTVTCATPVIDSVRSLCPVQIEVFIHDNGVNQYNVFLQRVTPSILAVNSYGVSGTYFTINTPYSGDQYIIAVEARCGSALSSVYVYPGNVTVKPLCNAPTNLVLSNPTCHGFTASWNADQCLSNSASAYDFYLREAGTINYNSYGVPLPGNGIGPHELLNFLAAGRTYQVFVRSVYNCNGFVTYGPTSQVETTTTLSSGCRDEDTDQSQENKPVSPQAIQYSTDNQEVFSLYPNPNSGKFIVALSRLSMEEDAVRIEVINMLGQTVLTHLTSISDGQMSEYINLPRNTSAGYYIVRLTAGKNVYTSKIVISK